MDWDELKPKPSKAITVGRGPENAVGCRARTSASSHSAAEIERVKAELQAKKAHEAAAAALFKR